MDTAMRCNSLKCRTALEDRAVVTTCSHIFCIPCSQRLGLASSDLATRSCPACETQLTQDDDVVASRLNPTEDYKTSVLSGLSPNVIMDCASRGLAFYAYQTTQEILYQEFLCKNVSDRHRTLNAQMDTVVHEANTEISNLRDRLSALNMEQKGLQKKNAELVEMVRQKTSAHRKLETVYRSLKQQQAAAGIELAAEHEADMALLDSTGSNRSGGPRGDGLGRIPDRLGSHLRPGRRYDSLQQHPARLQPSLATPSQRTRLPLGSGLGMPTSQRSTFDRRSPLRSALNDIDPNVVGRGSGGFGANVKMGRPGQHAFHSSEMNYHLGRQNLL